MKTHLQSTPPINSVKLGANVACAIYARVQSTMQAAENTSITMQLEAARKYAADRGLTEYNEYVDEGFSGTGDRQREQYAAMIEDTVSPAPAFKLILVYDYSRFHRDQRASAAVQYRLGVNGVEIRSISQPAENHSGNND